MNALQYHWYNKTSLGYLLIPVSWVFVAIVWLRRLLYRSGVLHTHKLDVPVIVVGNITVGGTGKTPLVVWLVECLRRHGYKPGIISRGYGGHARHWPQQVRPDSDPRTVGDEAVLLTRRCRCPMAVGPDRVAAGRALVEHAEVDVVVSDDGLQHYTLERDVEIIVMDGERRFGNGRCLPAGPLREPRGRLSEVDFVISNGLAGRGEYSMHLEQTEARIVGDAERRRALRDFRNQPAHAVAGIGYPARFFQQLSSQGLELIEHPFPDHYVFKSADLDFADQWPVLMTEKDAVKCETFAAGRFWYVPVDARLDERFEQLLLKRLESING